MFCATPEFEVVFRRRVWGEGGAFILKNKDINSSLNLHGDIKNKLECITAYYDWERGGGRASNTQNVGAKNYSLDLYGEINKPTKVYYDW